MDTLHHYCLGESGEILHVPLCCEEIVKETSTLFLVCDDTMPDLYRKLSYPRFYVKDTEYLLVPGEELDKPQVQKKDGAYIAWILQAKEDEKSAKERITECLRQEYFAYCRQANLEKNRFTEALRQWETASGKEPECLYLFSFSRNAQGFPVMECHARNITGTQGDTVLLSASGLPLDLRKHFANVNGTLLIPGHMLGTPVFCRAENVRTPDAFFVLSKEDDEKKVLSALYGRLEELAKNSEARKGFVPFWLDLLKQYKRSEERRKRPWKYTSTNWS